ncbi:DUF5615 family PIN-like protein [Crocosphaera watsonii]|uniref:DUF5615 domain-containing protein n=3 Tax=Crocosphaera watsonii TaxID=263511 RepID=T2J4J6_CROWT|nr:DUF5615 family PIN-like protein [Crocosphaera watsonii]CCQ60813.1 hypothetical protein CWATWH0401_2638 [Crocosphaera watsonii WH 0401]
MDFLIDVNASRNLGNVLISQGHDVAFVTDIDPEISDENILQWVVREKRVIITTDKDFEQLIWQKIKTFWCFTLREPTPSGKTCFTQRSFKIVY